MAIPYVYDIDVEYGRCDRVAPRIRRVVANNPSKFTFKGTGTYIIGDGDVAIIDAGPRDAAHVDALVRAVKGERVTHLLITHTHGDHSPAAAMLKQRLGDIPTYGFGPHPLRPDDERAWAEANPDEPDPELDAAIAAADADAAASLERSAKARRASRLRLHARRRRRRRRTHRRRRVPLHRAAHAGPHLQPSVLRARTAHADPTPRPCSPAIT